TIFEVLTSEASYQRSLSLALDHFQNSRKLSDCLDITHKHTLFSNLPAVRDVSYRFLQDLEEALDRDVFLSDIGDLIQRHCPEFHRVYIPYVTNQMYQENLMQKLVCNTALSLLQFFPLISRGRILLKHGELVRIFFQEMGIGHRHRLSAKPVYIHLFSDLLMLSRMEYGRFLVEDYASKGQVKADDFKAKPLGLPELTFLLRLRPNHAGVNCECILKANCETEKQHWISLIGAR
ncbi:hypothetical protein GDO86_018338, partial [Hymenochirus boettgeri]